MFNINFNIKFKLLTNRRLNFFNTSSFVATDL
jgi:hypothetical protein